MGETRTHRHALRLGQAEVVGQQHGHYQADQRRRAHAQVERPWPPPDGLRLMPVETTSSGETCQARHHQCVEHTPPGQTHCVSLSLGPLYAALCIHRDLYMAPS